MDSPEAYITIQEAADIVCVSTRTLKLWKKQGKLPYFKAGKRLLFRRSDMINLAKAYRP